MAAVDLRWSTRAIPFARDRDGNWRSVEEVPRGLHCDCCCPACDGPVVAKQGHVRVHHFAHHDRRECRHALEASLFGMTVTLLQERGAVLQLPPSIPKTEWLPNPDRILTPQQREKFFADPWVVPARQISLSAVQVRAFSINESVGAIPDVDSPGLVIHLLSHRKHADQVPGSETLPVLALDLRAYAKLWLETCDSEKDLRVAEATRAKGRLREWLARSEEGRVWISHPEVGEKRKKFDAWLARMVQNRREQTARQNEEVRERMARRAPDAVRWIIPFREYTDGPSPEAHEAAPVDDRDRRIRPLEHLRRVQSAAVVALTEGEAADLGLHWDSLHSTWVYVSPGGIIPGPQGPEFSQVPLALRRLVSADEPWEPVFPCDRGRLRAAQFPAARSTPPVTEPPPVATLADQEDEIIAQLESTCPICHAPQREVRFGSGLFAGKRAVQCSKYPRHPVKMLQ